MGQPLNDWQHEALYRGSVMEAALKCAAPTVALLALLARESVAHTQAEEDGSKKNFDRSFSRLVFIGLADAWFDTFGTIPAGVDASREPGGPA